MSALDAAIAAIMAAPKGPKIGAFFDFDGTLIDGYSAAAYFADRVRSGEANWQEIVETLRLLGKGDLSDAEFGEIIGKGIAEWAGKTEAEMLELWQRLFRKKIANNQFPEAWHLVRAHQRMCHTVAIASSATPYQAMPLAQEWDIAHLICTQPMIRNGKLTGGIFGTPAWGEGKAAAVRRFASQHGITLTQSYGYANGNEDLAFLNTVGHAIAVNPKPHLAEVASEKSWPVLRFQARRNAPAAAVARTIGAYGAMALSFAAGLGYAKATGNTRRAVDMIAAVGSEWGLAIAGIEIDLTGSHNLFVRRPCVFLLNHQSKLDFFVMMNILRSGFTGVAKKEAENTPGFGPFMRMADIAFIDRSDGRKAREALQPVVEKLKRGLSICIAPEGTRSYSPRLGAFKKGPFHIAMQAGVPLVPVVIRNAGEMMARNGQTFRPGTVQVAALPPIETTHWTLATMEQNIAAVRQLYLDTLEHWPQKQ
jgi:putative phosphoserine phosphatase/1-acylglycerol-3-phosphate O-acyltransferase